LCEALGHPEWVEDPLSSDNAVRLANRGLIRARLEREISSDTAAAWVDRISGHGAICEHVRDIEEAWADERLLARGRVGAVGRSPAWAGRLPIMSLARPPADTADATLPSAPALGEDTDAVARELDPGAAPQMPRTPTS
jgi:crotonobetainyl-CoA:carnitine CoA-transferase CaiB-like acyl-CoA transferase